MGRLVIHAKPPDRVVLHAIAVRALLLAQVGEDENLAILHVVGMKDDRQAFAGLVLGNRESEDRLHVFRFRIVFDREHEPLGILQDENAISPRLRHHVDRVLKLHAGKRATKHKRIRRLGTAEHLRRRPADTRGVLRVGEMSDWRLGGRRFVDDRGGRSSRFHPWPLHAAPGRRSSSRRERAKRPQTDIDGGGPRSSRSRPSRSCADFPTANSFRTLFVIAERIPIAAA